MINNGVNMESIITINIIVVRTCTGSGSRVLRKRSPGKIQEAPHLLVVRAGNSRDPGPVWLRQEAKRGAQWRRLQSDRGGDRAAAAATSGVFLNTARSGGIEYQKREEEMNESLQTVAARKPVRRGDGGRRSRALRRSVRESAAAAIGVQENTKPYTSRWGAGRPAAS